jgi:hypothetical protein
MDLSWLGNLLVSVLKRLNPLHYLKWSTIWGALKSWYATFQKWRDWYKNHVQKQLDALRAMQRQFFNTWVKPLLNFIDTLRRASQIVGLFSQKLAAKLNSIFFRIEGAILAPMRALQARINTIGHIFSAFLTPLGYFDRATLLNSVWRDVRKIREIFRNPLGGTIAAGAPPPGLTVLDRTARVAEYAHAGTGPLADSVNAHVDRFLLLKAELGD